VGGVRPNAEAKIEDSGRSLRANNEWIHEESNYCLVLCQLVMPDQMQRKPSCHDKRTSQRIRHARQTTSRNTKLLVVVHLFNLI
jgi:hypothetical protein